MKLLIILSSFIILQTDAGVVKDKDCDGVMINDVYHEKEVLKTNIDRPYLLAVDYGLNTIYFSYSVNPEDDEYKTAIYNLNKKDFEDITGVNNGFAQAVDAKTHNVYIGGSDGVYKFDHNKEEAKLYAGQGENIWTTFFKDILYYSTFPAQFLYTYSNGETTKFKDLEDTKVDHFLIDNNDDMFYTNATGLYSQKKGTKDAVLYKKFEENGIRGITLDANGNVYAVMVDGIYVIDKVEVEVDKIVDLEDAFGVAFDKDNNIIYSDAQNLVRLKPNKEKFC